MDWLEYFKTFTPAGLLGAVVWMVLTGRLVPRFFYKQKVEECNKWEAAATASQEQTRQLLEYARTADAILKALPRAHQRGGVSSEVD